MKQTVKEKLDDILDVEVTEYAPVMKPVVVTTNEPVVTENNTVDDDYEYARSNLKGLIENGKSTLENIMYLAKEGESPRAYEVAGQLIKTLADTNKDLLELAKKSKELKQEKGEEKSGTQIQNALFVGSTTELQKFLNKQ
jgi:hypothetical protein